MRCPTCNRFWRRGASGACDPASANPLSALMESPSGSGAPTNPAAAASTGAAAGSSYSSFDAGTMAALILLQGQSASGAPPQGPSQLFAKFDANGDGQISKSEFETALGNAGVSTSNADAMFAKLDGNGDGSISQSELAKAGHGGGHHHHHMHAGGGAQAAARPGKARSIRCCRRPARMVRKPRLPPIRTARPPRQFPMPTAARSRWSRRRHRQMTQARRAPERKVTARPVCSSN